MSQTGRICQWGILMSPVQQGHPAHEVSFPLSILICQPGLEFQGEPASPLSPQFL